MIGSGRASVWSPFAAWTGRSEFEVPGDGLAVRVIGHVRLLDAWTVSIEAGCCRQRLTIPLLVGLDRRTRLRLAFLGWYYEFGPGAGEEADLDLLLFLAEL